jgi:CubicO group peptidase (beta-lactamase class C family)
VPLTRKANSDVHLGGTWDEKFTPVADTLLANLETRRELGASIYVNLDGREVVDIWGGSKDLDGASPWAENTLVNVASNTKNVTSLAVLMLVDRGQLDVSAPVARYWPEFAENGKQGVLVRHLLSHTAGLPVWEQPFSIEDAFDIRGASARLAAQAPWWPPGSVAGYHASTYGHLIGELVLRVTGESLGTFVQREMARPLNADYYLGLPEAEFHRVAPITYPPMVQFGGSVRTEPTLTPVPSITERIRAGTITRLADDVELLLNSARWRSAELAGSNGHTNARGIGRIVSALSLGGASRGITLLSPSTIDLIFEEQARGTDLYFDVPIRWGIGYALAPNPGSAAGPLPFLQSGGRVCYWYGQGGSFSIMDVDRRLTITYVMNLAHSTHDLVGGLYYEAVYRCLSDAR